MTNQYQVTIREDGKVIVVLSPVCKISKEEIFALLAELGIDPTNVTFLEPDEVEGYGSFSGTPVIIPLDEGTCDLPELAEAGRHCGTSRGHVIVVFGPDFSYDGLHPIAEKYATQCGWSADQLKGCMPGKADAPRDASGIIKKRPNGKQVEC